MKNKLLTILATTMLITTALQSAEVIPVWMNLWKQGGWVNDFELLRGEDQFIMIAGLEGSGAVEIRKTLTGELVKSFPLPTASYFNQIEITPDSNRIVITTGGDKVNKPTIELRSIENFELIKMLDIKMDADSVDKAGQPYYYVFKDIVIDPTKPYVYAFITKTNYYGDDDLDRTWLKVYNYETMQEVKDLTPIGFEKELMKCMDVSDDGRFLAVLNEGKSYLKIWNTETFELLIDKQLYDEKIDNQKDYSCEVGDIEFSSIDTDLIYISGGFPNKEKQENPDYNYFGLYKYKITNDNFYKDYLGPNPYMKFLLFDNEERVLLGTGTFVVYNQKTNKQEIYIVDDIKYPTGFGNLFSEKYNYFLGISSGTVSEFRYDSQTIIKNKYEDEIIISPNPTTNRLNINLNSDGFEYTRLSIVDLLGNEVGLIEEGLLNTSNYQKEYDVSDFPVGTYFIRLEIGNEVVTKQFIKE